MTVVLELLMRLLGVSFASTLGLAPDLHLLAVVGVGVGVGMAALAVVMCVRYLVQQGASSTLAFASRAPFQRLDLRTLVTQSDPNAAGHQRTRAPALRPSAA